MGAITSLPFGKGEESQDCWQKQMKAPWPVSLWKGSGGCKISGDVIFRAARSFRGSTFSQRSFPEFPSSRRFCLAVPAPLCAGSAVKTH